MPACELLQTYPELSENDKLTAEMVAAADFDRAAVKFTDEKRPPETTEGTSPTLASLSLTATTGSPAPVQDVDSVMILDTGAVMRLMPAPASLRWRRFVGFDTDYVPQVIKTQAGAAALVVDAAQQGLVLVDAATGKLRWRQKIEDWPPAAPTVVRDRVLVASRSGQLMVFDLVSGQLRGHFHLPQPLRVPPLSSCANACTTRLPSTQTCTCSRPKRATVAKSSTWGTSPRRLPRLRCSCVT